MKLPKYVEDVARDIYNYISNNPKRVMWIQRISTVFKFKNA
jgi:GTP cyclohydrolase FolE2